MAVNKKANIFRPQIFAKSPTKKLVLIYKNKPKSHFDTNKFLQGFKKWLKFLNLAIFKY